LDEKLFVGEERIGDLLAFPGTNGLVFELAFQKRLFSEMVPAV